MARAVGTVGAVGPRFFADSDKHQGQTKALELTFGLLRSQDNSEHHFGDQPYLQKKRTPPLHTILPFDLGRHAEK